MNTSVARRLLYVTFEYSGRHAYADAWARVRLCSTWFKRNMKKDKSWPVEAFVSSFSLTYAFLRKWKYVFLMGCITM